VDKQRQLPFNEPLKQICIVDSPKYRFDCTVDCLQLAINNVDFPGLDLHVLQTLTVSRQSTDQFAELFIMHSFDVYFQIIKIDLELFGEAQTPIDAFVLLLKQVVDLELGVRDELLAETKGVGESEFVVFLLCLHDFGHVEVAVCFCPNLSEERAEFVHFNFNPLRVELVLLNENVMF
jgi:hypothetical protein